MYNNLGQHAGHVFTARRYATAVLAVVVCLCVCLSVCMSVRLSVRSMYCIKTAADRIRKQYHTIAQRL